MAKPPTKPGKPAPAESEAAAKPKSKLIFLIAAGVLVLGAVGGGAWYFAHSSAKEAAKEHAPTPPKFVALEPFTVNLQKSDEGEKFLQAGITLKIANLNPIMEEKIKANMPEIRSRLLLLLSSKHDSELISIDGKKKLAREIIMEANAVLGLQAAATHPAIQAPKPAAPEGAPEAEHASTEAVPVQAAPAQVVVVVDSNAPRIMEVLFTSFIIQ